MLVNDGKSEWLKAPTADNCQMEWVGAPHDAYVLVCSPPGLCIAEAIWKWLRILHMIWSWGRRMINVCGTWSLRTRLMRSLLPRGSNAFLSDLRAMDAHKKCMIVCHIDQFGAKQTCTVPKSIMCILYTVLIFHFNRSICYFAWHLGQCFLFLLIMFVFRYNNVQVGRKLVSSKRTMYAANVWRYVHMMQCHVSEMVFPSISNSCWVSGFLGWTICDSYRWTGRKHRWAVQWIALQAASLLSFLVWMECRYVLCLYCGFDFAQI